MPWTAPRTWVASEVVTAAIMNTHVRDNLKAIGDAWTTYTPTWGATTTNPTLGNGTLAGRSVLLGKFTWFDIELTIGSTTTVGSGTYTFTPPATARSSIRKGVGNLACFDTSATAVRLGVVDLFSTTTAAAFTFDNVRLNNAAPFVWAAGDTINLAGWYEAA